MKVKKRRMIIHLFLVAVFWSGASFAQNGDYPFFVFNNGVEDEQYDSPEEQVKLLKRFGYDGMEKKGLVGFNETLNALNNQGLKLYTIYINIDLDNEKQPYDIRLDDVFKKLEGSQTMPWFYITSKKHAPSSEENDGLAVSILQEIADMAENYGIKLMIYPHVNFWVDNVEDAIRVAEKVDRYNLGITFNLCHFLAHEGLNAQEAFLPLVGRAMPHLFAISLNGADTPTKEIIQTGNLWDNLIQPLGEGNYDVNYYFNTFIEKGFKGPVGLQCYNIKEPKTVHLKKSMTAWKNMQKERSK